MNKTWVDTPTICQELGCSRFTLYRLRDEGYLKQGREWQVANPTAARKTYRWNLAKCKKFWNTFEVKS